MTIKWIRICFEINVDLIRSELCCTNLTKSRIHIFGSERGACKEIYPEGAKLIIVRAKKRKKIAPPPACCECLK